MVFNGTNNDQTSKAIYQRWLAQNAGTDRVSGSNSADIRAALVEHFRDDAAILIATEAAAEGINLQFCNLVVNYDLPWNPQRIEQRIGRCHRYGQKFDVVVVNFLNKTNAADQRVYELLDEKFRLFNGVFGASDEVLGAVESGVDFEKRIAAIYQKCRTPEQIQFEFDQLQRELEGQIVEGQRDAREKLLDNFDQEVVEKVRIESQDVLDQFNGRLWRLTRHVLRDYARFDDADFSFLLHSNPFAGEPIHPGPYRMGRRSEDANTYRVGHPLAQRVLALASALSTPAVEITFRYRGSGRNIAILEALVGRGGWLTCASLTVSAMETEDHLFFAGEPMEVRRSTTLNVGACSICREPWQGHASYLGRQLRPSQKRVPAANGRSPTSLRLATADGSIWRWRSLTAGPRIGALPSRTRSVTWMTRSERPRRRHASPQPSQRSWSDNERSEPLRASATTHGALSTKQVAKSTGRKIRCWMRSASGWSRNWHWSFCSRLGGGWPDDRRNK
jgi:hypothetical protein